MQLPVFSLAENNTKANSLSSHISSKGKLQYRAAIIGADTNSCVNLLKAFKQSLSKSNTTSLFNRLQRGLEILEKSLIKRR